MPVRRRDSGLYQLLKTAYRVFVLDRLTDENIREILERTLRKVYPNAAIPSSSQTVSEDNPPSSPATKSPHGKVSEKILDSIVSLSTGDARTALSLLELAISASSSITEETLLSSLRKSVIARLVAFGFVVCCVLILHRTSRYDRSGDDRYDMISALHKSVRGSDGNAALYWLARYASEL